MKRRRLPLGVDIGAARVRIVALGQSQDGGLRLEAVGAADIVDSRSAALSAALEQVGVEERRCVATMRAAEARLHCIELPALRGRELNNVIRFEGIALFDGPRDPREPIAVRSVSKRTADGRRQTMIAAAPMLRVKETVTLLARAGLKTVCIDHEACGLLRLGQLPLLDVGLAQSTLIGLCGGIPLVCTIPYGGGCFTEGLAAELGTNYTAAEGRKRTIGLGGAASQELEAFARTLTEEFRPLRESMIPPAAALYVCGNGSRLIALRERIAAALGVNVVPVALPKRIASELPLEVERSGAIDWFAAIGAAFPASAEAMSWSA